MSLRALASGLPSDVQRRDGLYIAPPCSRYTGEPTSDESQDHRRARDDAREPGFAGSRLRHARHRRHPSDLVRTPSM